MSVVVSGVLYKVGFVLEYFISKKPQKVQSNKTIMQADLFAAAEPSAAEQALAKLDPDELSPKAALELLYSLKKLIK